MQEHTWKLTPVHYQTNEYEKYALEILQRHFRAVPFEKHPEAMTYRYLEDAIEEILGPRFAKKRVSTGKSLQIKEYLTDRIKGKYGRWVNIYNFKMKSLADIKFGTNCSMIFKTPEGNLYSLEKNGLHKNLFFTSHSIERFEERADRQVCVPIEAFIKKKNQTDPTAAEIILACLYNCGSWYARENKDWFFNVRAGVFVMEDYGDLFVVKTFLSNDMVFTKNLQWYAPGLTDEMRKNPQKHFQSLKELLSYNPIKTLQMSNVRIVHE